jgi:hypothetical protein
MSKKGPPTPEQHRHAQKRTHRGTDGKFAESLEERIKRGDPTIGTRPIAPPDDQQDAGGGFNPDGDDIQE